MAKLSKKANTKTKQKNIKKQAVKPKITKTQLTKKSQLKDVGKKAGRPKVTNVKIKKTSRSVTPMINDEYVANLMTGFNQLVTLAGQALQLYITKHQGSNANASDSVSVGIAPNNELDDSDQANDDSLKLAEEK